MLSTFAGGSLFGERRGTAPLEILALHGWGRSHADFAGALEPLGPSVALDLPGFGASPALIEPLSSMDFARRVLPVLDEVASGVILVGHSHGGRVAVCLATLAPNKVRGIVLVGAPVVRRTAPATPSSALRRLKFLNRLHLVSDARLEAWRRANGSADYRAAEGPLRDTLVRVVNESFDVELASLQCPVTLLWGADDTDVPLEVAKRAAALIGTDGISPPPVHLEVLEGIGHLVPTQAPGALSDAIRKLQV